MSSIQVPPHISATKLPGRAVDFEWDDDDADDYYDRTTAALGNKVDVLSLRGQLALSAAITEWIVWRFDGMAEVPDLRDFTEAVWAGVLDYRYLTEWMRPKTIEMVGPILGPQLCAARLLDDVLLTGKRGVSTDDETQYLAFLAQHVVKGNKAYKAWLKEACRRVAEISPLSDESREYFTTTDHTEEEFAALDFGTPIARAAFDTTQDYDPSANAADIDAFQRSLDPKRGTHRRRRDRLRLG